MSNFITFTEFKRILREDYDFVDCFNFFLKLPVFSNRLHYIKETNSFHVSPYPNSKLFDFDRSSVTQWVYSHRLPFFWSSEFYYGYKLGQLLFDRSCEELAENKDLADYLSKHSICTEIQKFLLYLKGTCGESYCLFWLDIERLKHTKHTGKKKEIVERIKRLYLRNGAPFEFENLVRRSVYFSTCEARTSSEEMAVFIASQSTVVPMIKKYWFEKYIRQMVIQYNMRNGEQMNNSAYTTGLYDDDDCDDDEDMKQVICALPRVIVDEGNQKDENVENKHEQLKEFVESRPVYLSSKRRISSSYSAHKLNSSPLFTPSSCNLFNVPSKRDHTISDGGGVELQYSMPFMQACMRCNFAAGNPITTFFMDEVNKSDEEELLDNPVNLLLLWLSIETLLTKDEMKRWYNSVKSPQWDTECPYFHLFQDYPLATDLESLLEMFIDDNSEFYVNLPLETQSQLHLLIPKGLGKGLLLETQEYICKKLLPFWDRYIVHENDSFRIGCVKKKDLSHLSDSIQQEQTKMYHESRLVKNILVSSFNTGDKGTIKRIWRAVEFSEVIVNPGLLHLPSRLSMRIYMKPIPIDTTHALHDSDRSYGSSTPGDIGPITYRGINLIPVITTVSTKIKRTAFKLVRTTVYCSQPATMDKKLVKKPSVPESFAEMLKNPDHIESFYNFLSSNGNGAEMGLVFWLAIEDLKDSIGDHNNFKIKTRRIMRRFFKEGLDITMYCKDTTLHNLAVSSDPDPFLLMDAQDAVAKSLESQWYNSYCGYLADDHIAPDDPSKARYEKANKNPAHQHHEQTEKSGNTKVKVHTKGLWNMFARNVIGFRHGLMDPKVMQLFKKYLAQEVLKGDSITEKKRLLGSRVVNVSKLLNDLSFWAEVERYKDMADVVKAAKSSGTYTPEDEIMVYKKAHAIINCYIDSSVPPRVQVNVSGDMVSMILDNLGSGNITRGLFHEAALNIFSILILYWKRFCIWRWSPKKSGSSSSLNTNSTGFSFGGLGGVGAGGGGGNIHQQDSDNMLGGCVLSFSLRKGLRLIVPPNQPVYGYFPIPARPTQAHTNKLQIYKIESARTMICQHVSRIISFQRGVNQ